MDVREDAAGATQPVMTMPMPLVPAVEILPLTPAAPLETPAIETVTTTARPPAARLAIRTAMKPELQTALCL